MKRSSLFVFLILAFFSLLPLYGEGKKNPLILGIHPYLGDQELLRRFTPMAEYLSEKLGKTVQVRVGRSYEEHENQIGSGAVDIAFMGPSSYVIAVKKFPALQILAKMEINGKPFFTGHIVVREGSSIHSIEDLKQKRFAFGPKDSTMGYMVPAYMLIQKGINKNNFMLKVKEHTIESAELIGLYSA